MPKIKRSFMTGLFAALIILIATPAFARSISIKDGGIALWIFIIIGAVIILLQLIPAIILFFSFIGTTSGMVFKRKGGPEEVAAGDKIVLPDYETATAKK